MVQPVDREIEESIPSMETRNRRVWLCSLIILAELAVTTSGESCNHPLSAKVTIFPTDTLKCRDSTFSPDGSANNFIIWSLKDKVSGVVSMVVAAPLGAQQWTGVAFSETGRMVESTAIVATLGTKGVVQSEQYYLGGIFPSLVVRDNTRISFKAGPELIYDTKYTTVYMAFQIDFNASKAVPNYLLYAQGPATGADNAELSQHTSRFTEPSQFVEGVVGEVGVAKKVKVHGALLVVGWGVLLPIGALVARHARAFDPAWFYTHIAIQVLGFASVIAGMAVGANLDDNSVNAPHLDTHKGLAVFVFALATLQVFAVVLRPHKDAKVRKYWNWYHRWVGRTALLLACVNIFLGFSFEKGPNKLKLSYIVLLALLLVAFVILETFYWIKWNRAVDSGAALRWNRASTERGFRAST